MPPPLKRRSEDPPESSGTDKRKFVQTKLNFPRLLPRPDAPNSSSSPSPSNAPSPPGLLTGGNRGPDGLYRHRQWLRQDNDNNPKEQAPQRQRQQQRSIRGGGFDQDDGYYSGSRELNRPSRGKQELAAVARETLSLIPGVLALHPIPGPSKLYTEQHPPPSPPDGSCPRFVLPHDDPEAPGFPGTRVRVVDGDSFDVAFSLGQIVSDPLPVLVLNLANAQTPGGGFLGGSMAQEEELCYRSTLHQTLTPSFYPMPSISAIYSPEVIVFRTSVATGHSIMQPHEYKRVAVVSVAAEYKPELTDRRYKNHADHILMMNKLRLILQVAMHMGHRRIVLGALGCGVFGNPSEEVAELFLRVFHEFSGGWWRDVVFAVLDTETKDKMWGRWGAGPYGSFWKNLDGIPV